MISIKFVNKIESKNAVLATIVKEGNENSLPPTIARAVQCKPFSAIIETFISAENAIQRCIVAKLESETDLNRQRREELGSSLCQKVFEGNEQTLILEGKDIDENSLLDILTGFLLASWRFNKYRTTLKPAEKISLKEILVITPLPQEMEHRFHQIQALIEGVFYARSLTSEPPNTFYPTAYAERLKELESLGVKVEVLDETSLQAIGMTALLAVGKGSFQKPAVVVMTWNGISPSSQPILIAGKGVCFDSGGVCLKPPSQQLEMKWDKAGAGVVAGLIKTLALKSAPVHIVGIIGLVENMPDGNATKTGDVITTMSGQTVEIADTDCEGRLVLADCLWYGQKRFNPQIIIDLGTLTLETVACLGHHYAGLYTNSIMLADELKVAGKISGDPLWELPMGPSFAKQIESSIADMKNAGVNLCGENAAAAEFLKRFITQDTPWAHIDIAGVSWSNEELPLSAKGVTGFGVRLLDEWINTKHRLFS